MRPSCIIHLFAILHAATALVCRTFGIDDELLLTVLTIIMSLIICNKKGASIEFTAAIIIVSNIAGYLMGTFGAFLLGLLFKSPLATHSIATALTSEVLGWCILGATNIFRPKDTSNARLSFSSSYVKWLLLASSVIIVIRLGIILFYANSTYETPESVFLVFMEVISTTIGLIILTCINILYIRYLSKLECEGQCRIVLFVAFMVLATSIEYFTVDVKYLFESSPARPYEIPTLVVVSLLTQTVIYCLVFLMNFALNSRVQMHEHMEKANIAQYRYFKLKSQVNPHFLFNSLNILDCLVCEEKTEQASIYIHKLASIYRYMLKSEDQELVKLSDELEFMNMYVELLKVRFPEGFDVITDIPEELMARYVLPCSLQLLIENATKHNAVSIDEPLVVKVTADEHSLSVSNNIVPKLTRSSSTGLGQKYIIQQYMDLSGKDVEIRGSETEYCVTLPLL